MKVKKVAANLLYSVSNKFKVNSTKTIVVLFSMTSHRIRIQPGINILNKFKKNTTIEMIENLKPYMRSLDYYGAMIKLLEDIN